ncbi:MAG: hypothetical protein R3E66_18725 [bacterium]
MRDFKGISVIIFAALFGCGDCGDDRADNTNAPDTKGPWAVEVCDNSTDDDQDGLTDCSDDDCFTEAVCEFEPNADAPDLPLNGVVTLWERSRWLFENGAVQRGVAQGKISPDTIGTVRGRKFAPTAQSARPTAMMRIPIVSA